MHQEIIDIINRDFPEEARAKVVECLSSIRLTHVMAGSEYNLRYTLLSILYLAEGNIIELEELTERAKIDFRDIVSWAIQKKNRES